MTSAAARVPSGIADVTPQWLTDVLGVQVTGARVEQIALDTGFSSLLYRVHLTGGAGVPASLIVKLPAESEARGAMEMLGGYAREVTFYRTVAGRAPLQTPHVHVAEMVENSADFVLVLEDLRDWENADHLAGLSMDRARLCIAQLAGLHAWSLDRANHAVVQAFPSLDTQVARDIFLPAFALGWQVYRDHTATSVPSSVAVYAEQFADRAPAALEAMAERSMLLHGDIRADNLFFNGDALKVVDYQFASRGVGAADIAYLVSQGLPSAIRRGNDELLAREYLEHLAGQGITDYLFDEAWRHYRFAVAYLMVLPVITLIGWDALPQRSRALCLTLTDRAVSAIEETDALEVFT
jgi:aminoglycoside phosphotransferase (APT) family kinase protein